MANDTFNIPSTHIDLHKAGSSTASYERGQINRDLADAYETSAETSVDVDALALESIRRITPAVKSMRQYELDSHLGLAV